MWHSAAWPREPAMTAVRGGSRVPAACHCRRYLSGYDSAAGAWPVLSVQMADAMTKKIVKVLHTSEPLDKCAAAPPHPCPALA